jgi:hypothetical protein
MYPNLVVAQKGLDFLDCFVVTPIALCRLVKLTNHLLKPPKSSVGRVLRAMSTTNYPNAP